MANNQIAPTFLNFANNVSLSQNKWNDSRLHQNKGCYYNNLLSPFWKRKESFIGLPFQDGNDVYNIENGNLYKNGAIVIQDLPKGYTYDLLSYEVLGAFSNYDGEQNYRFYRTQDNRLQIDFNDTVTDLNINEDYAAIKVIQIPTKTGYQASFGMLAISKDAIFSYKWINIHYNSFDDILIEQSNFISSGHTKYNNYVIIGGLVKNGDFAGFTIFSETGWHLHTELPPEVIIDIENLNVYPISKDNLKVFCNGTLETNFTLYNNIYRHYVQIEQQTMNYWDSSDFLPFHYDSVFVNPKTYFYFSKYTDSGITINQMNYPIYGFEMWIDSKEELDKSSLILGNNILNVNKNLDDIEITINSKKIVCPKDDYRVYESEAIPGTDYPGYTDYYIGVGFNAYGEATVSDNGNVNWSSAIKFNFSSASLIHENYQENIYCGYHKVSAFNVNGHSLFIETPARYFSFGYTNGKVCEDLNIKSSKTFDNLNPGDSITDPSHTLYKINDDFYIGFNSEGGLDNIVTESGNALMQWQNIDSLKFSEKNVIYGKFINNNQWFKIRKTEPYIVGKFNNYLLINCDGLNAFNLNTMTLDNCWAPGYNSSFFRNFIISSVVDRPSDIKNYSVSSMPSVKRYAAAVNDHPEIKDNYFCGSVYNVVTAYNFNNYTVGGLGSSDEDNFITFVYPIELYSGSGTNPDYVNTRIENSSITYVDSDLTGQTYLYSSVMYSYFLCNFSYEYYFNRFGIINLGNNTVANIIFINETYQVSLYNLSSILENIKNVFIVMGQIYIIRNNYIYSVVLDQNFTISYANPVTECTNLIFCGNTSKYAFFYSPLTKGFYRFSGSQIFEFLQDASDVVDIITYKNNYYMNVSLISFLNAEGHNKVLMIQGDYSVICWEDTDDLDELSEGNISNIVIEKDRIYLVTTQQTVYAIMFYDNKENFTKLRLEYESETLLNDFSQNIIDCVYVNVMKKGLPSGKVWVSLISGSGETKQEFNLKELMEDRNGLSLIRYQPKFQQRGRVAIRVESEVPVENVAYTVKTVGNEISHKRIEI